MEQLTLKGPIEYIKEAWKIYTKKENFTFFARVMAVVVLLTTSLGFVFGYLFPQQSWENIQYENPMMIVAFVILTLVSIVLGLWTQTTTYFSILKIGQTEKEVFRSGFSNMVKFFMISLMVGLIVLLGLVLLIIPAIIFGTWYSFSVWLVLDKGMKTGEALKASKAMVKGRFWKILGRSIVFGLFTLLISILTSVVPYAGNLIASFLTPLFMIPFYLLYRDLSTTS
jgi:uncharacterized membrane protein